MTEAAAEQSPSKRKSKSGNYLMWGALAGLLLCLWKPELNPAERFIEAPAVGYYQAWRVLEDGSPNDAAMIRSLMHDDFLSMNDSRVMWKAYSRLPIEERTHRRDKESVDAARDRLKAAVARWRPAR